jgi:hypothetical protein
MNDVESFGGMVALVEQAEPEQELKANVGFRNSRKGNSEDGEIVGVGLVSWLS